MIVLLLPEDERSFTRNEYNAKFVKWFHEFCSMCHIEAYVRRLTDEQSLMKIISRKRSAIEGVIFVGSPDKDVFDHHLKTYPLYRLFQNQKKMFGGIR